MSSTKDYIVSVPIRGYQRYIARASTAKEACKLVDKFRTSHDSHEEQPFDGGVDGLDFDVSHVGNTKAQPA